MSFTDEWLASLAFHPTPNGVRLDLRLYIYPDGHGNIHYTDPMNKEDRNQPVKGLDEALEALRSVWERAQEQGALARTQTSQQP